MIKTTETETEIEHQIVTSVNKHHKQFLHFPHRHISVDSNYFRILQWETEFVDYSM